MITESSRLAYLAEHKPLIYLFLTNYCSHRCWYCLGGKPYLYGKDSIVDRIGIDKYLEIALHLAGKEKVTFVLSGGDPTDHWSFKPIMKALLLGGHDIMIQTNGQDLSAVKQTIAEIGEEYYKHISWNISFHLGQYITDPTDERINKWIKNFDDVVSKSNDLGVNTGVIIVMTSGLLKWDKFEDTINHLKCRIIIQELYGTFDGKSYPTAYTNEERKRMGYLKGKYEAKDIASGNIDSLSKINRKLYLKGMPCFYMTRIRYVHVRGKIVICNSGMPVSEIDIMDYKSIAPISDYPQPCIYESCNCVNMGIKSCLKPNKITVEEYLQSKRNI